VPKPELRRSQVEHVGLTAIVARGFSELGGLNECIDDYSLIERDQFREARLN
jgi:hypothetical protein